MTRKRYCKLLMSQRFSRNQANEIAELSHFRTSYKDSFFDLMNWIQYSTNALKEYVDFKANSIPEVIRNVTVLKYGVVTINPTKEDDIFVILD